SSVPALASVPNRRSVAGCSHDRRTAPPSNPTASHANVLNIVSPPPGSTETDLSQARCHPPRRHRLAISRWRLSCPVSRRACQGGAARRLQFPLDHVHKAPRVVLTPWASLELGTPAQAFVLPAPPGRVVSS